MSLFDDWQLYFCLFV